MLGDGKEGSSRAEEGEVILPPMPPPAQEDDINEVELIDIREADERDIPDLRSWSHKDSDSVSLVLKKSTDALKNNL